MRTITFSSYLSPSEPIFQSLNILNFRKLVIQRVCLLMFKISKCNVPKPLHSLFRINNSYHNYQTRRSESIHVPIGRTEAIYKIFSYFGAHIWNHISTVVTVFIAHFSRVIHPAEIDRLTALWLKRTLLQSKCSQAINFSLVNNAAEMCNKYSHHCNNISTNMSYSSFKHLLKFYIQNNSHVK